MLTATKLLVTTIRKMATLLTSEKIDTLIQRKLLLAPPAFKELILTETMAICLPTMTMVHLDNRAFVQTIIEVQALSLSQKQQRLKIS